MRKSIASRQYQDDTGNKAHKPWVYRVGPPLRPVSILLVLALVFLAAVVALSSTACTTQSAVSTETDNFTVGDSLTLKVDTFNGRIEVRTGSDSEVIVQAELRDIRRINYEAIQAGDEILVTAEKTGDWWFPAGNTQADISVTVPANTALRLETSNGRIEVTGTTRGGILETSNGEIALKDVKGNFEATTHNGIVEIDGIEGKASAKTTNGRVTVREAKGEFNLKTSNGIVTFSGELTPGGSNRIVTTNGHVEVELTGTPSVSIDASTSNGEVTHDDVPILTTKAKTDHVIGTIGAGQAELYIETSNGDVIIR